MSLIETASYWTALTALMLGLVIGSAIAFHAFIDRPQVIKNKGKRHARK